MKPSPTLRKKKVHRKRYAPQYALGYADGRSDERKRNKELTALLKKVLP